MRHDEATQSQAAAKYVLGELPPAIGDEFEEHFFNCTECARDLDELVTFLSALREILADELV